MNCKIFAYVFTSQLGMIFCIYILPFIFKFFIPDSVKVQVSDIPIILLSIQWNFTTQFNLGSKKLLPYTEDFLRGFLTGTIIYAFIITILGANIFE